MRRRLLPCFARRILKIPPDERRLLDGQICKGIDAAAGSAREQCKARTARGAVHRISRDAVWSRDVRRYGGLRTVKGRAVAACLSPGTWGSKPRHVQPDISSAR